MNVKMLEIRDHGTRIAVMAIQMTPGNPVQNRYFHFSGYPIDAVILMRLSDQRATVDPYEWGSISRRTMQNAHEYIYDYFDELEDGQVIDVRLLLLEATSAAEPEIMKKGDEIMPEARI
jgi:hypothetical protein